ncbi:MAG: biopolymer transporter ExbD [Gammaproteobacteria bacterium]|nr:biopolymer transporter ExbD [Gammaproteobacteria bacterium]NVK86904.1 biopolymer transporter ExbD [Gammaproteobacteria bacterium]
MFQQRKKQEVSVNLTPLIDVVFLLLIFFMVSTSFNRETQIKLELPEAAGDPLDAQAEVIEISVDSEGRYFVNARPIVNTQVETLIKAIKIVANGNKDLPVIISADANAPYQSVVTAMDASRKSGYFNFTMATRNPQESNQ